jgi:hypothetical protein
MKDKGPTPIFSWLFTATGIFAILGALYTWGEGPILEQTSLLCILLPWGDLLITGPFSLLTAIGLFKHTKWAPVLGLMTSGIYVFGSTLVNVCLVWNGPPYPLQLALPALAGLLIGISYPGWFLRRLDHSDKRWTDARAMDSQLKTPEAIGTGHLPAAWLSVSPIREPQA